MINERSGVQREAKSKWSGLLSPTQQKHGAKKKEGCSERNGLSKRHLGLTQLKPAREWDIESLIILPWWCYSLRVQRQTQISLPKKIQTNHPLNPDFSFTNKLSYMMQEREKKGFEDSWFNFKKFINQTQVKQQLQHLKFREILCDILLFDFQN